MNSEDWSAKSARVITALTPGSASALEVSIDTMRAWGCGLRSTRPMSWPGRLKAAPKRARPVTLSAPSGRRVRVPTYVCEFPYVIVSAMGLSLSHRRGGIHHRAHDLVVPRAPAEVAGEPVADLGLRRVERPLEQGLGRHEEPGGADAALERGALQELLLQRMERLAGGHALDGLDLLPTALATQHETGADQAPVQHDAAGTAVPGGAAFLAARQMERVAEHVEQRLLRLAEELDPVPVHRRLDVVLGHQLVLARSSAIRAARRVSTPATSMRNSVVPRLSSIGRQAARAAAESRSWAASSSRLPLIACAPSATSSPRAATAPRPTRAAVMVPAPSTVKLTPAPTTAISISVRGMKRR